MASLPEPETIQTNLEVMTVFHTLFYQREDQAKAAIKGNMTFSMTMPYLPSDSADFVETTKAAHHLAMAPVQRHLFLLGTPESAEELEQVIASMDGIAQALQAEAAE